MFSLKSEWFRAILGPVCILLIACCPLSATWNADIISPQDPNPSVGKYEKLELGVNLPSMINCAVKDYLENESGKCWDQDMINWNTCAITLPTSMWLNPFAPEDISLKAVFTSPTGKTTRRYGFFYRDFERALILEDPSCPEIEGNEYNSWREVPTDYRWRIRFSPDEVGAWTVNVFLEVPNPNYNLSLQLPNSLTFNCTQSTKKGYVTTELNRQHLRYEDDESTFFGTGENLPFGEFMGMHKNPLSTCGNWCTEHDVLYQYNTEMNEYLDELHATGANMARITMNAPGYSPEWEQLGCYDCRQGAAWEFDQILEKADNLGIYIMLFIQGHGEFKDDVNWCSQFLYNWSNNPYLSINGLTGPSKFYGSQEARNYFKRRLRYIDARWGYSPAILSYELVSEADDVFAVKEDYYTNTQYQLDFKNWMSEMTDYVRNDLLENRKRHLLTASYTQLYEPAAVTHNIWGLPNVDLVCLHYYHPHEATNYRTRFQLQHDMWNIYFKPVMFNEMGSSHSHRIEAFTDMNLHNNVWATTMMGGFSCGFNWYANEIHQDDKNFQRVLVTLTDFMEGENLADYQWFAKKSKSFSPPEAFNWIENFYMTSESLDAKKVIGWAHNRSYYAQNLNYHPDNVATLGPNFTREVESGDSLYNEITTLVHGKLRYTDEERCRFLNDPLDLTNDYPSTNWPISGSPDLISCTALGSPKDVPNYDNKLYDPMIPKPACYIDLVGLLPAEDYQTDFYNTRVSGPPVSSYTATTTANGELYVLMPATDYDHRDWAYKTYQVTSPIKKASGDSAPSWHFDLHPNPSQGLVMVDFANPVKEELTLQVLNPIGQVVWEQKIDQVVQYEIDLSNHPRGVFFVRLGNSEYSQTQKLILQ